MTSFFRRKKIYITTGEVKRSPWKKSDIRKVLSYEFVVKKQIL